MNNKTPSVHRQMLAKWDRFIDIDRDGPWDAKIEMTKSMMYSNII